MYTYIVKYDVQPLIFRIMFYRPEDKWMLNNFQFTGSIDDEMEEASKISQ